MMVILCGTTKLLFYSFEFRLQHVLMPILLSLFSLELFLEKISSLQNLSVNASIFTLTAIAVDRYKVSCNGHDDDDYDDNFDDDGDL